MKKNLLYLNYVLSRKLTSATRNILRLVPATSIIVFSVGYDSNHMMLNGKFSYKKENQRTLSFNVDIVKLPEHKTVFTGSSSNWESFIWSPPLIWSCSRQLQCVRIWDSSEQISGTIHSLHLPALSHVRHDELGLVLRSSGEIFCQHHLVVECKTLLKLFASLHLLWDYV